MKDERGQAIVILVFALIALLAFAGLAIDGGRAYTGRRQAQNAADAAAMAGAHNLALMITKCQSGSAANDSVVAQALVDIARLNGIDHFSPDGHIAAWYVNSAEARLGPVGFGQGIPIGATGVEVTLVSTTTTTFMKVIGRQYLVSHGTAMAMTGPVKQLGGGVLPIGVPLEVIQALGENERFYMMDNQDGTFCEQPGASCIGDPNSDNAHRGWLNLNYNYNLEHRASGDPLNRSFEQNVPNRGCGSDPTKSIDDGIQGWSGDDCPYPFTLFSGSVGFMDGDFIHGSPGARQSSLAEVVETYNGRTAYVPIFDAIYTTSYMSSRFSAPEEPADGQLSGDRWPSAGGGGSAYLYHIVGFAAVKVSDNDSHDHMLVGEFQSAVIGESQIQPGAGLTGAASATCGSPTLYGVVLWK